MENVKCKIIRLKKEFAINVIFSMYAAMSITIIGSISMFYLLGVDIVFSLLLCLTFYNGRNNNKDREHFGRISKSILIVSMTLVIGHLLLGYMYYVLI